MQLIRPRRPKINFIFKVILFLSIISSCSAESEDDTEVYYYMAGGGILVATIFVMLAVWYRKRCFRKKPRHVLAVVKRSASHSRRPIESASCDSDIFTVDGFQRSEQNRIISSASAAINLTNSDVVDDDPPSYSDAIQIGYAHTAPNYNPNQPRLTSIQNCIDFKRSELASKKFQLLKEIQIQKAKIQAEFSRRSDQIQTEVENLHHESNILENQWRITQENSSGSLEYARKDYDLKKERLSRKNEDLNTKRHQLDRDRRSEALELKRKADRMDRELYNLRKDLDTLYIEYQTAAV